jgi:hypothetical protein
MKVQFSEENGIDVITDSDDSQDSGSLPISASCGMVLSNLDLFKNDFPAVYGLVTLPTEHKLDLIRRRLNMVIGQGYVDYEDINSLGLLTAHLCEYNFYELTIDKHSDKELLQKILSRLIYCQLHILPNINEPNPFAPTKTIAVDFGQFTVDMRRKIRINKMLKPLVEKHNLKPFLI